jgi:hypothetical protein
VVANAGEILHAATTDEHRGVLLKVVTFAGDVAGDFHAVREADAAHLAESGVRLLRRGGVDADAHAALLGTGLERRGGRFEAGGLAALADELIDRRHNDAAFLS